MTFDELIDAEIETEEKIRQALIAIEEKTGLRLDYVRVVCPTLEVDVSLKPRELDKAALDHANGGGINV